MTTRASRLINLPLAETFWQDFGNANDNVNNPPICTISGSVFNDANGDNLRVAGEAGITGFRIFLDLNANRRRDAGEPYTRSDSDGHYTFTGLRAGTYRVTQTLVDAYARTSPIYHNTSLSVHDTLNRNFGQAPRPYIHGKVFEDLNCNRKYDTGEPLLPGVKLSFVNHYGETFTATSSRTGHYNLYVRGGYYTWRLKSPAGWVQNSKFAPRDIAMGQPVTFNYALARNGVIQVRATDGSKAGKPAVSGLRAYLDLNKNDAFDASEPSVITGAESVSLPSLAPGDYPLRLEFPDDSFLPFSSGVTVQAGHALLYDLELQRAANINGIVFDDKNANGVRDAGESPVSGAKAYVDFQNSSGGFDWGPNFITDAQGHYKFKGIRTQVIKVGAVLNGWRNSQWDTRQLHDGPNIIDIPLTQLASLRVTVVQPSETDPQNPNWDVRVTVPATVYIDSNRNGSLDAGEMKSIAPDGSFDFDVPAGTYSLRLLPVAGFAPPEPLSLLVTVAAGAFSYSNFRLVPKS